MAKTQGVKVYLTKTGRCQASREWVKMLSRQELMGAKEKVWVPKPLLVPWTPKNKWKGATYKSRLTKNDLCRVSPSGEAWRPLT